MKKTIYLFGFIPLFTIRTEVTAEVRDAILADETLLKKLCTRIGAEIRVALERRAAARAR